MQLVIDRWGVIRGVYGEAIDLSQLGDVTIRRASHVEPDGGGRWWADLAPVGGPSLGPFGRRSEALAVELMWLEDHLPSTCLRGSTLEMAAPAEGTDFPSPYNNTIPTPEDRPWD